MKKAWCVLLITALIIAFYGCSTAGDEKKKNYSDDELIRSEGDSFSFQDRTGETGDSQIEVKYSKFIGAQTIWNIAVDKQGEIKFEFKSDVDGGKFKGVLIPESGDITTVFEGSKEGSHMVVLPEGKYRFKIVGNNASGEIKIDLILGKEMKSTAVED